MQKKVQISIKPSMLFSNFVVYLRNKFDFWNVHGILNTSGL